MKKKLSYHVDLEKEEHKEQNSETIFLEKIKLKHHSKKNQ